MTASPSEPIAGVWAAIPTPFAPDGALDLRGVAANAVQYAGRFGCDGVFCNGVMGEGWALTVAERQDVLSAILDAAGDRLKVGVVATHQAPAETLALCRHAGKVGAHHVVLMRPRGLYEDDELIAFCQAAAEASGGPAAIFESPAAGMGFGARVIEALAAKGLVLAVKATGGDKAAAGLRRDLGDAALICDPHEARFLSELARAPDAPLYADPEPYLYQAAGARPIRAYRDAARAGDWTTAHAIARTLTPLRAVYDRWIIGRLDRGRSPVPGLKHWAARIGLAAGPPRFPLRPLAAAEARDLDAALDAAGVPAAQGTER